MISKTLMNVLEQTKLKSNNSIIQKILGRDKYFMLNLVMLKKLGPDASCFLTFILDRADFLEKSNQITSIAEEGIFLYRSDIQDKVGISPYTQRKIEKALADIQILFVVEEKLIDNQTRNRYFIDLENLDKLLDKE